MKGEETEQKRKNEENSKQKMQKIEKSKFYKNLSNSLYFFLFYISYPPVSLSYHSILLSYLLNLSLIFCTKGKHTSVNHY